MSILKLRRLERQFNNVNDVCNKIKQDLDRIHVTRTAVEQVPNIIGDELLSPLADGMFIKTQCLSDNVHVNVGAGVIVEKNVGEATDLLDMHARRLHEQLAHQEKVQDDISKNIMKRIEEIENVRETQRET